MVRFEESKKKAQQKERNPLEKTKIPGPSIFVALETYFSWGGKFIGGKKSQPLTFLPSDQSESLFFVQALHLQREAWLTRFEGNGSATTSEPSTLASAAAPKLLRRRKPAAVWAAEAEEGVICFLLVFQMGPIFLGMKIDGDFGVRMTPVLVEFFLFLTMFLSSIISS